MGTIKCVTKILWLSNTEGLKKHIYLFFFLAMICISNDKFGFGHQLKRKLTGLSLWLNTKYFSIISQLELELILRA